MNHYQTIIKALAASRAGQLRYEIDSVKAVQSRADAATKSLQDRGIYSYVSLNGGDTPNLHCSVLEVPLPANIRILPRDRREQLINELSSTLFDHLKSAYSLLFPIKFINSRLEKVGENEVLRISTGDITLHRSWESTINSYYSRLEKNGPLLVAVINEFNHKAEAEIAKFEKYSKPLPQPAPPAPAIPEAPPATPKTYQRFSKDVYSNGQYNVLFCSDGSASVTHILGIVRHTLATSTSLSPRAITIDGPQSMAKVDAQTEFTNQELAGYYAAMLKAASDPLHKDTKARVEAAMKQLGMQSDSPGLG